ncbi:hypothetical protein D3C87_1019660 [compost metagenome]
MRLDAQLEAFEVRADDERRPEFARLATAFRRDVDEQSAAGHRLVLPEVGDAAGDRATVDKVVGVGDTSDRGRQGLPDLDIARDRHLAHRVRVSAA